VSVVLLTVDTPEGSVDLAVDGAAALQELFPAVAVELGLPSLRGWRWWDGARRLDPTAAAGLDVLGVVSGSRLLLLPPARQGWI